MEGAYTFVVPLKELGYITNPLGITDFNYECITNYGIPLEYVNVLTIWLILSQLVVPRLGALLARGRLVTVGMA